MNIKEKRKCSVFIGLVLSFFVFLFPNNFKGIEKKDENSIPAVSVIVPVYKTEKYLKECADSISGQTLKNIEIIYVDDGSPDNCPKMLDKIAENDKRVKVIHKKNQGASAARQAGLDIAVGEYIKFVDSDDILDLKACEICYNKAKESGADVLYHSAYKFDDNRTWVRFNSKDEIINEQIFKPVCLQLWRGLYKTEFLIKNDINFNNAQNMGEDFYFNMICTPKAKITQMISDKLYFYRGNNNSSLRHSTNHREWWLNVAHNFKMMREYWEKSGYLKNENARFELFKFILSCIMVGEDATVNKSYMDTIGETLVNDTKTINKLPPELKRKLDKIISVNKAVTNKKSICMKKNLKNKKTG